MYEPPRSLVVALKWRPQDGMDAARRRSRHLSGATAVLLPIGVEDLVVPTSADPLEVPPAVLERFGSRRARPRVIRAYTSPSDGYQRVPGRPVLTTAHALRLREQGVTLVELVWRWRRVEMTVTRGYRSVWGADTTTKEIPVVVTLPSGQVTDPA